jgi:hypothetical protein
MLSVIEQLTNLCCSLFLAKRVRASFLQERFADAVRRRQIAGRRQGEQLAGREWPVLALQVPTMPLHQVLIYINLVPEYGG